MSTDGSALGYAELLRLATAKGLQELDTTIVQIPADQNHGHAVVVASVRTSAALYRTVGEAWWESTRPEHRQQALVLAEVRAKTRALCEAVGMPQLVTDVRQEGALPLAAGTGPAARGTSASPAIPPPQSPEGADRVPRRVESMAARPEAPVAESSMPTPATPRGPVAQTPRPALSQPIGVPSSSTPQAEDEFSAVPPESVLPEPAGLQGPRPRPQPARPAPRSAPPAGDGLGPDILQKLLQMTQRIGELKQEELSEEDALAKLDSFFQRAFSHPLAEGTRMEGQRVVQRLASDLARLSQERSEAGTYAAS